MTSTEAKPKQKKQTNEERRQLYTSAISDYLVNHAEEIAHGMYGSIYKAQTGREIPGNGKQRKKKVKDPYHVPKAQSGFFLWLAENRPRIQVLPNGKIMSAHLSAKLGAVEWKELNEAEREEWNAKAEPLKVKNAIDRAEAKARKEKDIAEGRYKEPVDEFEQTINKVKKMSISGEAEAKPKKPRAKKNTAAAPINFDEYEEEKPVKASKLKASSKSKAKKPSIFDDEPEEEIEEDYEDSVYE